MTKTYMGDPLLIELDCEEDISSATVLTVEARRPDRTIVTWPGTLYGTTQMRYQADGDDLNQIGVWRFQPLVDFGDGDPFRGETVELTVYADFK
jgi:hypothetical protein